MALTTLVVGPSAAAWAAPVAPSPKKVAAATTSVSSCGSLSGIGMYWTSIANVVTSLTLTSIPAACNGSMLTLTLAGSGNASIGSIAATTITGTSQTFTSITGSPTATAVTGTYISVLDP